MQLSSSPVSSLGVVSDSVTTSQSDPLRQWSVLLGSFSQLLLGSERFVSLDVSITVWNSKLKIHKVDTSRMKLGQ